MFLAVASDLVCSTVSLECAFSRPQAPSYTCSYNLVHSKSMMLKGELGEEQIIGLHGSS